MFDANLDSDEECGIGDQFEHDARTTGAGMLQALLAALVRLLNEPAFRQFGDDLSRR